VSTILQEVALLLELKGKALLGEAYSHTRSIELLEEDLGHSSERIVSEK
jgi:hypothetical protein